MAQPPDAPQPRQGHPISVVTRRTGLTQDLLRAWEKRYHAVVPRRTATGRRIYTDRDIEKLRLLKLLVDGGRRISDVADLDIAALTSLAQEDQLEARHPLAVRSDGLSTEGDSYLVRCAKAIEELDEDGLNGSLGQAALAMSPPRVRDEVVVPLLTLIGARWQDGTWRVAHEHFASAVLRAFLWDMHRRAVSGTEAPVVVAATPSGHRHELGLLLAMAVAAEQGWSVVYLGPDVPSEEIAAVTLARRARAVLISLVFPANDARTAQEIVRLGQLLGPGLPIFAGGRAAESYRDLQGSSAILVTTDLDRLKGHLQNLAA